MKTVCIFHQIDCEVLQCSYHFNDLVKISKRSELNMKYSSQQVSVHTDRRKLVEDRTFLHLDLLCASQYNIKVLPVAALNVTSKHNFLCKLVADECNL